MPSCSFKLFSELYALNYVFVFKMSWKVIPSVSASIRDSSLNHTLKWQLLSAQKNSQNQIAEHIPQYLAQLLGPALNACQDVFLSKRDTKSFQGKHSCLLAELDYKGHCAGCLNPPLH